MAINEDASPAVVAAGGGIATSQNQVERLVKRGAECSAHIIVVGNGKGGSGKTTTAMHLIVALLHAGLRVASVDVDSRQDSLTRFVANRRAFARKQNIELPFSDHITIGADDCGQALAVEEAKREFDEHYAAFVAAFDFVVIDTPGSDSVLSRYVHSYADTLITPFNDSFVDLDMLATIEAETLTILHPSCYAEMVWEQKKKRARRDSGSIDWVIMRNRLSNEDLHNKQAMAQAVSVLAQRIGFRIAPGFTERVIFRELFLKGLTLLDLREPGSDIKLNISHVAGRQEIRGLIGALRFPPLLRPVDGTEDIGRDTAQAEVSDG